jgi:hypothetical protein
MGSMQRVYLACALMACAGYRAPAGDLILTAYDPAVYLPGTGAPATTAAPTVPVPAGPACTTECPPTVETWWDNFSLFTGLEASRQPQDLGINANFGGNVSANVGIPLWRDAGVGLQVGTGVNMSRAGVKVLKVVEGTNDRVQWFNTFGVFKRGDGGYIGCVYDLQYSDYYANIFAGQFRAEVGLNVGADDVVGLFGNVSSFGDEVHVLATDFIIRPISQLNLFWNHRWQTGAETRVWLGVAGQHGTDIVLLPDDHRTDPSVNFGLQVFVPLSENFALFGQGNYVTPSDTGTLDAYLGLAYFFGGAANSRRREFAPVMPVANNPTFALDLRRP